MGLMILNIFLHLTMLSCLIKLKVETIVTFMPHRYLVSYICVILYRSGKDFGVVVMRIVDEITFVHPDSTLMVLAHVNHSC